MAGHSKFKNIMHRKGAQDAKRGKIFTKLIREITVAAKAGGAEPDMNPRLRTAIIAAKAGNMPKDNIDRAIKKATDDADSINYEAIRYEGYGSHSVAIIVEALTDNRNRSASIIRSTFAKHGGNLGESNSVAFSFNKIGVITYNKAVFANNLEQAMEIAIEAGADDVQEENESYNFICQSDELHAMAQQLSVLIKGEEPVNIALIWQPNTYIKVNTQQEESIIKLIDALEDIDDVQNVFFNYELEQ
jgi:YebC/PmpR family DNA-binding regulatory protein